MSYRPLNTNWETGPKFFILFTMGSDNSKPVAAAKAPADPDPMLTRLILATFPAQGDYEGVIVRFFEVSCFCFWTEYI